MPPIGHWYVLVLLLLIVAAGIGLIGWAVMRITAGARGNGALAILDERFARGEIDQQEYQARKAALTKP